jgi:serine/threonine-protein kinase
VPSGDDNEKWHLLVLKAIESGDWAPVMSYIANHPEDAEELARFVAAERTVRWSILRPTGEPAPGSALGGLELREKIGGGGMGVVHRAFDPRLKRDVAVKFVRPDRELSVQELARLRFEAETVASLDHPNVVRVYSLGEAGGSPFLVMPLMEGGTLATRLRALGPDRLLPAKEAAAIVRDVALGVHHAHQRGLIHRDLKPGNILFDADGRPAVADFGLARRVDATTSSTTGPAGTLLYMAPEQVHGDKPLTTAVDVHALGIILFELLTGTQPFAAPSIPGIVHRVIEEPALPVRKLRPDIHPDLEAVCARCLEKQPEERYPSALALAEALDRFLNDEPQLDTARQRWLEDLSRAIRRRVEAQSIASWPGYFWGLGSLVVSQTAIQAAVLTGGPAWIAHVGWAVYFAGWFVMIWLFGLARMRTLNRFERTGVAHHLGMMTAGLALVPVSLVADRYGLALYPPLLLVIALGTFIHGTYWGRFYVLGFGGFLIVALLVLVPAQYRPAVFATHQIASMIWTGARLRGFDREARAADPSVSSSRPT